MDLTEEEKMCLAAMRGNVKRGQPVLASDADVVLKLIDRRGYLKLIDRRGYMDGWREAELAEKNRPGIHVIMGQRICDGCGEPIAHDQRQLYWPVRWWEIWKTGRMTHANCEPR